MTKLSRAVAVALAIAVVLAAGFLLVNKNEVLAQGDSPIDISDGSIHATAQGWDPVTKYQVYRAMSPNSDSIDLEGFTYSSGPAAPTNSSPTGGWLISGAGGWVITISNSDRPGGPKGSPGNKKNKDSISVCSIGTSDTSCGQPTPGDGHSVLIATDEKKRHGKWEEMKTANRLNSLNFHDRRKECNDNAGGCNFVELINITSANKVAGANGDTYNCSDPENCHIIIGR